LIDALDVSVETPVTVLSESSIEAQLGAGQTPSDGGAARVVVPSWNRRNPHGNATAIEQQVKQYELKVVHFQHEYGLWPNENALRDTLRACRAAGAKIVVTLHTVIPFGNYHRSGSLQMFGALADAIIVHTREAQAAVLSSGPKRAQVFCVPHGTKARQPGEREAGLERLNVPHRLREEVVWGLIFGFQGPSKNVVCSVRAFAEGRARGQVRNCGLLIVGEAKDEFYAQQINGVAMESGYLGAIFKSDQFATGAAVDDIFAAADFGVLNNTGAQPTTLSASGQVHLYASYGVPLVCANVPVYSEALNADMAIPFELDSTHMEAPTLSCINGIAAMSRSGVLRREMSNSARTLAKQTDWGRVAETTAEIYGEVLS
jgi:glycosyltransferase involved in cell wall biosynthesis